MLIENSVDKRIYDFILQDMKSNNRNYSALTNPEISKALNISPNTIRDKVARLARNKYIVSLLNHWDENNNFFNRKILLGPNRA